MTSPQRLFSFEQIEIAFDPFPIGYARNVLPADVYRQLIATYPSMDLFLHMPKLGKKYSLSELNNKEQYFSFLRQNPVWERIYQEVKSPEFVEQVIDTLHQHRIDLGLRGRVDVVNDPWRARRQRFTAALECLRYGTPRRLAVRTRFEFSMLPANGGHIKPHTDNANKIITLVVSCMKDGEWNPVFGGGTAILRPKDAEETYNHVNRYLEFERAEEIRTLPFTACQCVIFVKTFNSLHAVAPMTGVQSPLMRKTLTINLETY